MGGDGGMEMRTGVWGEGRERDWSVERKAGEGGEEEGGERERERGEGEDGDLGQAKESSLSGQTNLTFDCEFH
jgi:hypothetical protein